MKFLKMLLVVVLIGTLFLILYWAILPDSPSWTGFGPYDEKVSGSQAKTLWDWMELLIIPVVLSIGVWWLNKSEKNAEREIAKQKDETEREIAAERQRQTTLESYFDRMTELLLHEDLRSLQKEEVQTIARTRTLAVLRSLDSDRKGQVIRFLYEANLLKQVNPAITLAGADLIGTDLRGAILPEINLSGAHLIKSNLSNTELINADFSSAQLVDTDLTNANLTGSSLIFADLRRANLKEANLDDANMRNINLSEANLKDSSLVKANMSDAKLVGADLSGANLHEANLMLANLTNAQIGTWERTHLRGVDLMGATLVDADLIGADLSDANLTCANLLGATLNEVDFSRANLTEVLLESMNDLKTTKSLHDATLPDGTIHDGRVVFENITSVNIMEAIKLIDKKIHDYDRGRSKWVLVHKGRWYPLDALIPLAYKSENGLPHDVFNEKEANEHLSALGFTVQNTLDLLQKIS